MKSGVASLALCALAATSAFAATPPSAKLLSLDRSGSFLIDADAAELLWRKNTPARLTKMYPVSRYRFVSEVTGGFTDSKTCVVTARAMLLPVVLLPVQGRKVVYSPIKSATAFDSAPALDRERCRELARDKLTEAIQSLSAALAPA